MADKRTLNEYLDEIRQCEDPDRLRDELKVYDNWPVLLYGSQDELFSKVVQAFRDSPKAEGISDSWRYVGERNFDNGRQMLHFVHELGAEAQLFNRPGDYLGYWGEEHRVDGQDHSVFLMFHGTHAEGERKVHWIRGVALAVAGFGDYILRENIPVRFTGYGLELNYIPE
jgi:hypothetical protein